MKILFINASPKPNGNVSQMLKEMREVALQGGHEVEYVRTATLDIKHCTGCMYCRKHLECILPEDDAQHVLQKINDANLLIIGAPCYWGNIPGELKILFDRIVYGMMGESKRGIPMGLHKGKRAFVVTTCTTPYPFNILFRQTRGVVKALREILGYSGFKFAGAIQRGGTKNKPLTERDLQRSRKMAHKIMRC